MTINTLDSIIKRDELIKDLFPNLWVFLAHVIAATVVITLITLFAWKPTQKLIADRKTVLDEKMKTVEKNMKLSDDYLAISKQKHKEAQKLASQIVYDSQKMADQFYNTAKERAEQESKQIYDKALADAKKIRAEAETNVKKTAIKLGFDLAEKIISKNVNNETNQKFVNEYLKQIS